jgi:hypothetical protein
MDSQLIPSEGHIGTSLNKAIDAVKIHSSLIILETTKQKIKMLPILSTRNTTVSRFILISPSAEGPYDKDHSRYDFNNHVLIFLSRLI